MENENFPRNPNGPKNKLPKMGDQVGKEVLAISSKKKNDMVLAPKKQQDPKDQSSIMFKVDQ